MFVTLYSSVCFRNVGCWHVPVLEPVALSQGSKKKLVWNLAGAGQSACWKQVVKHCGRQEHYLLETSCN